MAERLRIRVESARHDLMALLRELPADSQTDAGTGAGNDRHLRGWRLLGGHGQP